MDNWTLGPSFEAADPWALFGMTEQEWIEMHAPSQRAKDWEGVLHTWEVTVGKCVDKGAGLSNIPTNKEGPIFGLRVCPHCGGDVVYEIVPAVAQTKEFNNGSVSAEE